MNQIYTQNTLEVNRGFAFQKKILTVQSVLGQIGLNYQPSPYTLGKRCQFFTPKYKKQKNRLTKTKIGVLWKSLCNPL
jgi:hypothetical protein